jgi:putative transposase
MVDTQNKLSIVKQSRLLEIHRVGLYYKAKQESSENLKIMRLLDQQYFNTPFYGCRKLTFWLKELGYKVNRKRVKRLMKIISWQTIYKEPRTTMSKKEHMKYSYLPKGLRITHKNQV